MVPRPKDGHTVRRAEMNRIEVTRNGTRFTVHLWADGSVSVTGYRIRMGATHLYGVSGVARQEVLALAGMTDRPVRGAAERRRKT